MFQSTLVSGAKTIHAISTVGIIVQVEAETFLSVLACTESPLVITFHRAGRFGKEHLYLTPYRGVYLYVEAKEALQLPVGNIEEIITSQMWIPRF